MAEVEAEGCERVDGGFFFVDGKVLVRGEIWDFGCARYRDGIRETDPGGRERVRVAVVEALSPVDG